jgi:hypothetical protein
MKLIESCSWAKEGRVAREASIRLVSCLRARALLLGVRTRDWAIGYQVALANATPQKHISLTASIAYGFCDRN